MARMELPEPTIRLTKTEARRFLLAHQRLWPPRQLQGKPGILAYVGHVGCIQFDPINVVGRNPDLVLQSRVADYRPELLEELLYGDRELLDGFDKVSSIYRAGDWPYFGRHRALMRQRRGDPSKPAMQVAPAVWQAIREEGPLSSIDLKHDAKVDWSWGPTRVARAALETLYAIGELGVHHRVGTRRAFDLIERLLPAEVLEAPDPNETEAQYQDWHVLRRIGGMGLANLRDSGQWLGILGVKTRERRAIVTRLVERGDLAAVAVEGLPERTLFLRTADLPTLEAVRTAGAPEEGAAVIGALDNLTWDRELVRWIFSFDYTWEVYKPVDQRRYGYYVLPVIYGDRFVARFDPTYDKQVGDLIITNWWWEEGVVPDGAMEAALGDCFQAFGRYLGANGMRLGDQVAAEPTLQWVGALSPG
jgi:uncharacterized protein YcaQ